MVIQDLPFSWPTDIALDAHAKMIGFGWIIHDYDGSLIMAKNDKKLGPSYALIMEAFGYREALSWISIGGLENVVVETNSLILFLAMVVKNPSTFNSTLCLIFQDCKYLE